MPNVKTYAGWNGDIQDYLAVGDLVDEEMVDYFVNVLPPRTWQAGLIQIGEPYSEVQGRSTWATLKSTADGWAYAGHCFAGESTERKTAYEYGIAAFKNGKQKAPALDRDYLETHIKGLKVGEGIHYHNEWHRGFIKAQEKAMKKVTRP